MKGMKVLLIIGVVILITSLIKNNDINNSIEIRVRIANSNIKEDQAKNTILKISWSYLGWHPQNQVLKELEMICLSPLMMNS